MIEIPDDHLCGREHHTHNPVVAFGITRIGYGTKLPFPEALLVHVSGTRHQLSLFWC